MDDSREIIYLALNNQVILYYELLAEGKYTPEEKGMAEYIIKRSEELIDQMANEIIIEIDKPIPKPQWDKPTE